MMGRELKPICWPICVLSADLKGESVLVLSNSQRWPHFLAYGHITPPLLLSSHLFLTWTLLSPSYKNSPGYTGPTQINQDNLAVARVLTYSYLQMPCCHGNILNRFGGLRQGHNSYAYQTWISTTTKTWGMFSTVAEPSLSRLKQNKFNSSKMLTLKTSTDVWWLQYGMHAL